MFGKKKPERPKRSHEGRNLAQYGLFEIPQNFDTMGGTGQESEGDSDLEAELAALAGGGSKAKPTKKPVKQPLPQAELDAIVAKTLEDIPSDEDIEVDENDPDLLSELNEITDETTEQPHQQTPSPQSSPTKSSIDIVNVLNNRLKNYQIAEANARSAGESGKARRYGRAIKTLNDLIRQANAGKNIDLNDDSIPPEMQAASKDSPQNSGEAPQDGATHVQPSRPAPGLPTQPTQETALPDVVQSNVEEIKNNIDEELLNMLQERQKEYKIAALKAKKDGDSETALSYVKIAKQFDHVLEAVKNGQPVDLSKMPGPPGEVSTSKLQENETQKQAIPEIAVPEMPQDMPEPDLITASSVGEALEQRLQVYKDHETKAKEEGNNSKARRFGRIVKQFEQAIKSHKAGRPIAFDELPTPPGYAPIPGTAPSQPPSQASNSTGGPDQTPSQLPSQVPSPVSKPRIEGQENEGGSGSTPSSSRLSGNKQSTSYQEKQIQILLAKQKQFKTAALQAKKKGEINEAKEFLRQSKGFDKLINAAQAGFPIDWASIPISPEGRSQLDNEYDIVMQDECTERDDGDADVLTRLEIQLTKQLKMCLSTRDHHKNLGDVPGANRFERLALNVTKDLDVVRVAKRTGTPVPKFHYEQKDFSIVKSFTDLNDNDMELSIVRGINYACANPKDIDTYVKFEFPFPQETPFTNKTGTIKDTNNPEYNVSYVIPMQRNSRQCQRVFKRHGIKFEVYSKGGFLRSDTLLGTVNVKLQPLETQCELHDSFDLMDGRKKVGGKLEVQIRLRQPIATQQVEQIHEKWLVIDQ